MRQDIIDQDKEFFDVMIHEMAISFGSNVNEYVVTRATVKKAAAVAERETEAVHRYGVNLTQEGENLVYRNLVKVETRMKTKYHLDKFDSKKEAKDIMCIYILKEVFALANIPFKSNYDKQLKNKKRTFDIKMAGFIVCGIFFIIGLVAWIIVKLS